MPSTCAGQDLRGHAAAVAVPRGLPARDAAQEEGAYWGLAV